MQKIGEGKFAKVKLCVDVNTKQYYAAKIINKERIRRKTIIRP
jgi:serine/threonine protein kinase